MKTRRSAEVQIVDADLPARVKDMMRASDWQAFIIAMMVIGFSFYGLIFQPTPADDVRLALASFVGAVITYFFGRSVGQQAATSTVRAMNGHSGVTVRGDSATVDGAVVATTPRSGQP